MALHHSVAWDVEHVATCSAGRLRWSIWDEADEPAPVEDHAVPVEGCTCGVYAYYRPGFMAEDTHNVFGVVEASGRALLGERGFRAARARIVALTLPDGPLADGLGAQGVAVFPDTEKLLAEFPPDDVTTLLGHEPLDPIDDTAWGWGTVSVSFTIMADFQKAFDQLTASMQHAGQSFRDVTAAADRMTARVARESWTADERKQHAIEARRSRSTGPDAGRYRIDGTRQARHAPSPNRPRTTEPSDRR